MLKCDGNNGSSSVSSLDHKSCDGCFLVTHFSHTCNKIGSVFVKMNYYANNTHIQYSFRTEMGSILFAREILQYQDWYLCINTNARNVRSRAPTMAEWDNGECTSLNDICFALFKLIFRNKQRRIRDFIYFYFSFKNERFYFNSFFVFIFEQKMHSSGFEKTWQKGCQQYFLEISGFFLKPLFCLRLFVVEGVCLLCMLNSTLHKRSFFSPSLFAHDSNFNSLQTFPFEVDNKTYF